MPCFPACPPTEVYYRAMSHERSLTKDWTHLFALYRGQWVALADDEVTVLAAGATAKDALAASAAKGLPDPILYRVPDSLDPAAFERLKRQEQEVRARIRGFNAADRLSRDEVHEREITRGE
jgi:hypothetical protein